MDRAKADEGGHRHGGGGRGRGGPADRPDVRRAPRRREGAGVLAHPRRDPGAGRRRGAMRSLLPAALVALALLLPPPSWGRAEAAGGIVSVGGAVTEIVYALGQQDRLLAVDTTSLYPAEIGRAHV